VKVLDRKLAREVKSTAGMLAAVTGIIAVGVTCFVTLLSSYLNLSEAQQRYYAQCRMADFSIEIKKIPVSDLGPLADIEGVAEIRPRIQFYVTVDLDDADEPLNGMVLSLPDYPRPVINDVLIRQGSYFTDRRQNEVIVNQTFARYHGLRPGQWIRVVLHDRQQELFIVGTAISSEFVYLLGNNAVTPDPKGFGVFYLKQSYAEEAFDFKGSANQVLGRTNRGANVREILRKAEDRLSSYGVFTTTPLEDQISNRFLSQEIRGLRSFATISPTIFLVVAASVLNVLLTRLAEHQRTIVGTLKALGYGDRQIFWHFLKHGLIVGVTGGLAGCALGYWLANGMAAMYRHFFEFPDLYNHFYAGLSATALAISMGCAALGSYRGSRAVLQLQPAEAMRAKPPRQGRAVLVERIRWFWNALGSGWRMVLRNVFRNRLRTAAGVFSAAMGSAVLVNSFMFFASPRFLIDFQFRRILRSDFDLSFKDERGRDAIAEAARLPGVDYVEPLLYVACTFSNGPHRKKGTVTGLIARPGLTVPRDVEGRAIRIPATGLAMSRMLAEILHVRRGDLVTLEPVKGLRRPQVAAVVEISDSYLGLMVYADIHYLSRLIGEELAVSGMQLSTDQNSAHRRALYHELKQLPVLQSVTARADMIHSLEDTVLRNQSVIIALLVLFAGIVFFGSILNASLVSLAERQREVATLRVLGYGPWMVGSLLLRESLITTLLGTLLGMPLGYLLTRITAAAYASDMFRLPIVTGPGIWFWTFVLAIVFWLLAHLAVQREIHHMDWLEAIKVSE
jgi:putative ABC transport system permease protein